MAATLTATVSITHNTTKRQLIEELERIKIPDSAKLRVQHFPGDQRDPSYTNLVWTWSS